MVHVSLRDVALSFPIYDQNTRSLRKAITGRLGGHLEHRDECVLVQALSGIDIDIAKGDKLGIVGHNGAGKTTLLRVISGIYEPDFGCVEVVGRVASLTNISLGMDPEATGWENIILRCVFMGMTFAEAREHSPAIAEFAELDHYLDMPVRTYSTGMFLRLAFAISTSTCPEIVVMDEMISAGDQEFIAKAKRRMEGLLATSEILVLASHDPQLLGSMCNRVLWLEQGRVKAVDRPDTILRHYLAAARNS